MARRKDPVVTEEASPVPTSGQPPATPVRIIDLYQPTVYERAGVKHTIWHRVGTLIDRGYRVSVHLVSIPLGGWNGWLQGWPRKRAMVERPPEGVEVVKPPEVEDKPARGRKRKQEGA